MEQERVITKDKMAGCRVTVGRSTATLTVKKPSQGPYTGRLATPNLPNKLVIRLLNCLATTIRLSKHARELYHVILHVMWVRWGVNTHAQGRQERRTVFGRGYHTDQARASYGVWTRVSHGPGDQPRQPVWRLRRGGFVVRGRCVAWRSVARCFTCTERLTFGRASADTPAMRPNSP